MSKKTSKPTKKTTKKSTKVLDEETSALVIAEYLAIEKVETREIAFLEEKAPPGHWLNPREIALTFRVSEVLDIRDCFEMAPRFRTAFALARAVVGAAREVAA